MTQATEYRPDGRLGGRRRRKHVFTFWPASVAVVMFCGLRNGLAADHMISIGLGTELKGSTARMGPLRILDTLSS